MAGIHKVGIVVINDSLTDTYVCRLAARKIQ